MLPTSAASGLGNHLDNVTTGVWNGYDNMAVEDFSTWGIVLGLLCIFIISVALRWFMDSTVNIFPAVRFGLRRSGARRFCGTRGKITIMPRTT